MGKLIPSRADRLFGANVFADFCLPPEERIKSQVCSFCSAKLYRNTKLAKRFSKFSKKLSTLKEINFKKKNVQIWNVFIQSREYFRKARHAYGMKKGQSLVYLEQIKDENPLNSMKMLKFLECGNANQNSKRPLEAVIASDRCLK